MTVHQIIKTQGEDLVVLTVSAYRALVEATDDAADGRCAAASRAAIARGDDLALPGAIWDAIETSAHPLGPIRKWRALTQQQLAAASGVAQPTISAIEGGRKRPTTRSLSKLAKALSVPVGHLIAESPREDRNDGDLL